MVFDVENGGTVGPESAVHLRLREVLAGNMLSSVFQPILDIRQQNLLGYEALVRGPVGSPLHTPAALFGAARADDDLLTLSLSCLQTAMQAFAHQKLQGKLFVNISPRLLTLPAFQRERAFDYLAQVNLTPDQIIIELTEDDPVRDFQQVHDALLQYRAMGFQIAMDDMGQGFSSLRLWSALKPEFVKADKHFVTGVARDPVKLQFLKAMQALAESAGSAIIAEGIESPEDLRIVRELGIAYGQGFLIGIPSAQAVTVLPPQVSLSLTDARIPVQPAARYRHAMEVRAEQFRRDDAPISPRASLLEAEAIFQAASHIHSLAVVDNHQPVGVLARHHLREGGGNNGRKRHDPRGDESGSLSVQDVMQEDPIIVDAALSLSQLADLLAKAVPQQLTDGFIIKRHGKFFGMGVINDVLRVLNESNQSAARYANPLTLLPGPVPINQRIERLLASRVGFKVCAAEIYPMKGFNDSFGFEAGDELIRAAADSFVHALDVDLDFVGHFYGNRFLLILQTERAETVLADANARFALHCAQLLPNANSENQTVVWQVAAGKHGEDIGQESRPFPTLVGGMIEIPDLPKNMTRTQQLRIIAPQAASAVDGNGKRNAPFGSRQLLIEAARLACEGAKVG